MNLLADKLKASNNKFFSLYERKLPVNKVK